MVANVIVRIFDTTIILVQVISTAALVGYRLQSQKLVYNNSATKIKWAQEKNIVIWKESIACKIGS